MAPHLSCPLVPDSARNRSVHGQPITERQARPRARWSRDMKAPFRVEPLSREHRRWANELLTDCWGATQIVTRGNLIDAASLPGLVALEERGPIGLFTYCITHLDIARNDP